MVLLAAKLAAEVAERLHFPTVVGEILAGIVVGPSVLDLVGGDATLRVLVRSASSSCCSRSVCR